MIEIERIYQYRNRQKRTDEYLILVDRLWPRGIRREGMYLDEWLKELGPSNELRKWFGHEPAKWEEFKRRYLEELKNSASSRGHLNRIQQLTSKKTVTLLYSARDEKHNQAEALKSFLLSHNWINES